MNYLSNKNLLPSGMLIDGRWVDGSSEQKIITHNPATGEMIGLLPCATLKDVTLAIDAGDKAFSKWRATDREFRSNLLKKWAKNIKENQQDIATIITLESGKPLKEARAEVEYAISFIDFFAAEIMEIDDLTAPSHIEGGEIIIKHEPAGLCALITPWNFPAAMITRKIAPALAAGCTLITKPSEKTPLTAIALGHLAQDAGFPAGVINIITGDAKLIANILTTDPRVKKISFTGSTRAGKELIKNSAQHVQRISMELGGNAPAIIFKDANIKDAAQKIFASKFRGAGQTCICVNRIIVHEDIEDEFTDELIRLAKDAKLSNGLDEKCTIGPLISKDAAGRMQELIADALALGAKILIGGERAKNIGDNFFKPTIITNVTQEMRIFQEEIFGPIAPIMTFSDEDNPIEIANNTKYGLAAYIFCKDKKYARSVADRLDFGMVGINETAISNARAPFGGVKESGIGREGSRLGLMEYMEMKYILQGDYF